MIDTIKIRVPFSQLKENYFEIIIQKLSKKKIIANELGNKTLLGFFKNMHITLTHSAMWIEGSLPRYFYGTNQYTLNRSDVKKAIKLLELELEIDLRSSIVQRLDLAHNIITKYPVEEYYPILTSFKKFKKMEMDNGIAFKGTSRYIIFYGKIKSIAKEKQSVRQHFLEKNVLRFENRYLDNKAISKVTEVKNSCLSTVITHYNKFVLEWSNVFDAFNKRQISIDFDYDIFATQGLFDKLVRKKGIEAFGGMQKIISTVNSAKSLGYLKKYTNEGKNLINRFQNIYSIPEISKKSELTMELQKSINYKTKFTLANLRI